jgi:hypothetical protein
LQAAQPASNSYGSCGVKSSLFESLLDLQQDFRDTRGQQWLPWEGRNTQEIIPEKNKETK